MDPLNEYYKISALYFYYLYTYPQCKSLITNCQYVGTIHSRFKSHVISPCQCLSPLQHIFTKIDTCNLHIFPWSNSTCNYSHLKPWHTCTLIEFIVDDLIIYIWNSNTYVWDTSQPAKFRPSANILIPPSRASAVRGKVHASQSLTNVQLIDMLGLFVICLCVFLCLTLCQWGCVHIGMIIINHYAKMCIVHWEYDSIPYNNFVLIKM